MIYTRRDLLKVMAASSATIAAPVLLTGCSRPSNPIARSVRAREQSKRAGAPATPVLSYAEDLTFRRASERGRADHGWLQANHSFSFARYRDPEHMGFRALRVLNEDYIAGAGGFPMHPHRDMEILTYILDGALEHKDSMGNGGVIRPGEVQTMSAGTGIRHSEFNPSGSQKVHLLQIWIKPNQVGHAPRYAQQRIPKASPDHPIRLIASEHGDEGSVQMHQDVRIHACKMQKGQQVHFDVKPGRHVWVQGARGSLTVNHAQTLNQGDGVSTSDQGALVFEAREPSEILIFDLA